MTIGEAIFRASPLYELVQLDQLPEHERKFVADASPEDDLYGVLRPRSGTQRTPRAASTDVALLFLTLAQPGSLPSYAIRRLGAQLDRSVAKLVLDGVLEVERNGSFVSGAAALDLLGPARAPGTQGRISDLSAAALRYAQALVGVPVDLLAFRLYSYGRRPVSPARKRRFGDEKAIDMFLGLARSRHAGGAVGAGWTEVAAKRGEPWRMWRSRREGRERCAGYKLYVSPAFDSLPQAVAAVAETLSDIRGATGFKVARDVDGLCRPDKVVAYFTRLADLQEAGARLGERLRDCPAHGVPFTAEVTSNGLLSWGIDPPSGNGTSAGPGVGSWRLWVVRRLAEYLLDGRATCPSGAGEPWMFALERLRLDGVDTDTWIPVSGIWDAEAVVA